MKTETTTRSTRSTARPRAKPQPTPETGTRERITGEPFIEAAMEPVTSNRSTREQAPREPKPEPVHFELTIPTARKVCIAGSFNDWRPDATEMIPLGDGKWAKDLTLSPGTYEYRLVVDGQWMADPNASRTTRNPFGDLNSVVTVPAVSHTQRPEADGM
jgi:1,4-alpha-glucan branching enzyme